MGWGTNTVTVLLNDGTGRFASSRVFAAQHGGYEDLEVGDVSGDGRADIVVMSGQLYAAPNVSVLAQTANGFGSSGRVPRRYERQHAGDRDRRRHR